MEFVIHAVFILGMIFFAVHKRDDPWYPLVSASFFTSGAVHAVSVGESHRLVASLYAGLAVYTFGLFLKELIDSPRPNPPKTEAGS